MCPPLLMIYQVNYSCYLSSLFMLRDLNRQSFYFESVKSNCWQKISCCYRVEIFVNELSEAEKSLAVNDIDMWTWLFMILHLNCSCYVSSAVHSMWPLLCMLCVLRCASYLKSADIRHEFKHDIRHDIEHEIWREDWHNIGHAFRHDIGFDNGHDIGHEAKWTKMSEFAE